MRPWRRSRNDHSPAEPRLARPGSFPDPGLPPDRRQGRRLRSGIRGQVDREVWSEEMGAMGESGQARRGVLVPCFPRAAGRAGAEVRKYAGQPWRPARIGASPSVTSGSRAVPAVGSSSGRTVRPRRFEGRRTHKDDLHLRVRRPMPLGSPPTEADRSLNGRSTERIHFPAASTITGCPRSGKWLASRYQGREAVGRTLSNEACASPPTHRELCRILEGETSRLYYITVVRSIHRWAGRGEPGNDSARRSGRIGQRRPTRGGAILKIGSASPGLGLSGDYCRSVDHARSAHHRHSGNRIREGWR